MIYLTDISHSASIAGEITDRFDLDFKALSEADNVTVILALATGKRIILRSAWFAGDGTGNTEEGNLAVRWESNFAEEDRG